MYQAMRDVRTPREVVACNGGDELLKNQILTCEEHKKHEETTVAKSKRPSLE
jgi:hypothetical protein